MYQLNIMEVRFHFMFFFAFNDSKVMSRFSVDFKQIRFSELLF